MARIDVNQKITSRLPIEPERNPDKTTWKFDGLCPVILHEVALREQIDEQGEFQGITRKVLDITFTNFRISDIEPERFTTLSEKAIGTKMTKDGALVIRPEEDVITNNNDMFKRIKHILDGCQSTPTYRSFSGLDEKTLDEYFDLPGLGDLNITAEENARARAAQYDKFLQFMHDWFNGVINEKVPSKSTKSVFRDANGKSIVQGWLKVVPAHPNYNYYHIPTWVSQGFFEFAPIDPQTKYPRKPIIIKVKASESLELMVKGRSANQGSNPSGMPPTLNVSPSMMQFLSQQQPGQ